jgi:hypothetical protein
MHERTGITRRGDRGADAIYPSNWLVEVRLEIAPEPTEEERAAIAAALAETSETNPSAWESAERPHGDHGIQP